MQVEEIKHSGAVLAVVASGGIEKGVRFITPDSSTLQFGVQSRSRGESVKPHYHNDIKITGNIKALEGFYIIDGKVAVSFYDAGGKFLKKCFLSSGSSIVIFAPHSLEFLEDTRMIEAKQGPYKGKDNDKIFIR